MVFNWRFRLQIGDLSGRWQRNPSDLFKCQHCRMGLRPWVARHCALGVLILTEEAEAHSPSLHCFRCMLPTPQRHGGGRACPHTASPHQVERVCYRLLLGDGPDHPRHVPMPGGPTVPTSPRTQTISEKKSITPDSDR